MIPDIAVGAVGAALIGAMISLVGLIVTKEAKVSEFRQAWIDNLRTELATFITHLNALEDAIRVRFKDDVDLFDKTKDSISKLNEAYFSVALRLNMDEDTSKLLRNSMVSLSTQVRDSARNPFDYDKEKSSFISLSNRLLKAEWIRVKTGERVYRATRLAAAATVVGLFVLAALIVATGRFSSSTTGSDQPSRSNKPNIEARIAPVPATSRPRDNAAKANVDAMEHGTIKPERRHAIAPAPSPTAFGR